MQSPCCLALGHTEQSVLDEGALRRVMGHRILNRNADIVGIFETEVEGMATLNRLAFPWRGVIPY